MAAILAIMVTDPAIVAIGTSVAAIGFAFDCDYSSAQIAELVQLSRCTV